MILPKYDDLKTCLHCKHPFKEKVTLPNIKKCYCTQYTYATMLENVITEVTRSWKDGDDVFILKCFFDGTKDNNVKRCYLHSFQEKTFKQSKLDIPIGMFCKIPLTEDKKKMIKFCKLVQLLY